MYLYAVFGTDFDPVINRCLKAAYSKKASLYVFDWILLIAQLVVGHWEEAITTNILSLSAAIPFFVSYLWNYGELYFHPPEVRFLSLVCRSRIIFWEMVRTHYQNS